jgi:hypothetical protein
MACDECFLETQGVHPSHRKSLVAGAGAARVGSDHEAVSTVEFPNFDPLI